MKRSTKTMKIINIIKLSTFPILAFQSYEITVICDKSITDVWDPNSKYPSSV